MKKQGPSKIIIPSSTTLSCSMCEFYARQMVCSGREPVYEHFCTHPEARGNNGPFPLMFGNLPKDATTPIWCPFLNKTF